MLHTRTRRNTANVACGHRRAGQRRAGVSARPAGPAAPEAPPHAKDLVSVVRARQRAYLIIMGSLDPTPTSKKIRTDAGERQLSITDVMPVANSAAAGALSTGS